MPFIGNQPAKVPLTSADITDGIITSAKIADGTIVNADINASAAIAQSKLSGSFGKVLQVVSTTKTDTTSTTSSTFSDITGLSVSITPSSTSNKIYVTAFIVGGSRGEFSHVGLRLMRNSTAICVGTEATGNRTNATAMIYDIDSNNTESATIAFLDSPASTSATTYKIQFKSSDNSSAVYLNKPYNNTDLSYITYCASTITAIEIAG